ncbi:myb-related protein A-like [Senna tora]|uniref:Myb-related protein A-like n=1 Tax=Senna tora TaxID=362788 RepID=A0A834WXR3_9FABA|nr:myb-related protein A-like [Senna tora]
MPRSSNGETRKSCNRGHWRPAEDERLKQLVEQYGPQNWNFIAEHLDGRSVVFEPPRSRTTASRVLSVTPSNGLYSTRDSKLTRNGVLSPIQSVGTGGISHRTCSGKSCRLRWYNQLDPNIVKRPFTEEEEEMLLSLHKVKGNKWAAISRFLPGRTDNAVKNHFHVLMARRKRDHFTLFGERRSHEIPNNHIPISNPNPMKNFKSQDTRNMSIFGIPSIGKVVPLPYNRFSSSSSNSTFNYYNGQRIEDSSNSNQSKKLGEKHFLAFSELPNKEEGQGERLNGGSSNNVSFIDFLGVGI